MRFRFLKSLVIFQMAIVVITGVAYSAPASDFSADMISSSGGQSMKGKIYVSNKKIRMEMPQATAITRMDKNVSWILMPDQGMYMEQSIDPKTIAGTSKELPGEIERQSLGREDVSGRPAEKFLVRYNSGRGEEAMHQWTAKDGFLLKAAGLDSSWSMEYRDIHPGPQPDNLFEVPAEYKKFEAPNMGNVAQMMQKAQDQGEN